MSGDPLDLAVAQSHPSGRASVFARFTQPALRSFRTYSQSVTGGRRFDAASLRRDAMKSR